METRDPNPFGTRSKLLGLYSTQVREIQTGGDPFPVQMEVNLYDICNQRCAWCISEDVRGEKARLDVHDPSVRRFFSDFGRLGGIAVGWSGGGEPTLHPGFDDALALAADAGLSQGLLTHGAFDPALTAPIAEHCAWTRVSIDTHDREAYAERRGTRPESFDRVLANCRALVDAGAYVGLNINVGRWNLAHVESLYDLASGLGVAYLQVRPTLPTPFEHLRTDPILDADEVEDLVARCESLQAQASSDDTRLIVSHDKLADFLKEDGGRGDPRQGYRGCQSHRVFVVLNSNGDLAVCMYHLFDQRFVMGNVYTDSLETIWASERRQSVRQFCDATSSPALHHRLHGCQVCCKGHEINKVLANPLQEEGVAEVHHSPFL